MTYPYVAKSLTITIPCFNEQEIFALTVETLSKLLENLIQQGKINSESCLLFVDDGSQDHTWELICGAAKANPKVKGIKLSHNKGHQIALLAGLYYANTDIIVSIDADLQDDPQVIEKMLDLYYESNDIVYGVRNSRQTDSNFKRLTALAFYKIIGLLGVEQVYNHADFRLMSRRSLNALLQYEEENLYLRGLIPMLGFKTACVYYDRKERAAGESKYPLKKMLSLALEGITSLSVFPLRAIALLGISIFLLSIIGAIYILIQKYTGTTIQGWTSMTIIIAGLGGLQMLALGIIGEYIGKIYKEVKRRPKFFIESSTDFKQTVQTKHDESNKLKQ